MDTAIMSVDRRELDSFCDGLPEPIIASPVVLASRGRGLLLALDYPGAPVTLTEDGKPCRFRSVDDVIFELDGIPNVDASRLVVETANYWGAH